MPHEDHVRHCLDCFPIRRFGVEQASWLRESPSQNVPFMHACTRFLNPAACVCVERILGSARFSSSSSAIRDRHTREEPLTFARRCSKPRALDSWTATLHELKPQHCPRGQSPNNKIER